MKLYRSPPNNSDGIVLRSVFVHSSFILRSSFDRSSIVPRLFFDCSSIVLRSGNGERTKNERRMNEGWTRTDRRTIENLTKNFFISYGLTLCEAHFTCEASLISPRGNLRPPKIYVLRYAYPMKTAVRLGAISPITGWPVWCGGIRKPGMRIRDKPSFTYLATLSHP